MSTNNSQFQLVSANSSVLDSDDSSRAATYRDFVRNSKLLWDTLHDFFVYSGKKIKIPIVGGYNLDLHRLFIEVTSRGGLEKVIKDRKCKEVIDSLKLNRTVTNSAFVLRKYYLKMLFEFEHENYFKDPPSSFWEKGPQELQPGFKVSGVIDGTFENGYFVTVKMGSEEFKGVLYDIPQAPPETQRPKKKSKSSQVDSQRPKFHRSGYGFVFAENYPRLIGEFAGHKRIVIEEIENVWRNLSESDRKIYEEKGLEDVQRYNMEMLQHGSPMDSGAAETVAATDAAASGSGEETVAEEGH